VQAFHAGEACLQAYSTPANAQKKSNFFITDFRKVKGNIGGEEPAILP